ncbi:hypothetical protein [Frigoriglobus tundricola]|uniref:Uncharacterized protein n=1 Tax=Frigoriglobus tundricola TaxID=2774151 RepID=A0A6M5YX85_9BACT|nr:hypothetical protein [Frigoriglobus tundricola]QJW97901.1 hypothetical protein FTUN_5481 [Frigoriglobus tundricola]
MIRFNCPNCERPYEIPDALARLPLVCKHCGQRITVPEPTPEPPPPVPAPRPAAAALQPPVPAPPKPAPQPKLPPHAPPPAVVPAKLHAAPFHDDEPTGEDVLVTKADSTPNIDFNVGGPTAASLSDAARARPAGLSDARRAKPAPETTEPDLDLEVISKAPPKPAPAPVLAPEEVTAEPSLIPLVADLVTFVVLVVAGMLLGEFLAQKPTGTVLSEAGSAAVFPPTDLLLWGSPPATFALVYLLLYGRERSVGAWLRKRRTS